MAKDWKGFERTVAKSLGSWWGCVFRRTPSSGAWGKQGQSRFAKKSQDAAGDFHGDIVAPPEADFPFSVECKCYREVEIYKAMYGKSNVWDFWAQCRRDTPEGMYPMLVMKENMKKPLMGVSMDFFNKIKPRIRAKHVPYLIMRGQGYMLVVMDLASFTSNISAIYIKKQLGL